MAQSIGTIEETIPQAFLLKLRSLELSDEQFRRLCNENPDLKFELTAEGELLIMPPTGAISGNRNAKISARLFYWAEADGSGVSFDSSTLFVLPNGARRSPDASWIRLERWNALSEAEKEDFAPICPDFVIELRSRSDRLTTLKRKMEEYLENGAQLGWLIDPQSREVTIYRPQQPPEVLENPAQLSGEAVLNGFVLQLAEIW